MRSSKSTQSGSTSGLMQTFNLVPANKRPAGSSSSKGSSKKDSGKSRRKTPDPSATTNPDMWQDHPADWQADTLEEEDAPSLLMDWLSFLVGADNSFSGHESALYCLGDWVDTVQEYVGQNEVVDSAVTAVLCGAAAFRDRTEESVVRARESNMNALRMLRLSLSENGQRADSRGALVATKLLDLAEVRQNSLKVLKTYRC